MNIDELYAGLKVRIIWWDNYRPDHWATDGAMDEWRGALVTIASVYHEGEEIYIEEDEGAWQWFPEDFDPVPVLTPEDPNTLFKKAKHKAKLHRLHHIVQKLSND